MKLALLTLLVWAALAAVAHASTVAVNRPYPSSPTRLDLLALPGERNDVQIDPGTEPGTVRVHDAAGLRATAPCVAQDATTAVCPAPGHSHVELRDGDDRIVSTLIEAALVVGGDGDDELRWNKNGRIDGGPGDDVLSGSHVDGGPGDDVLEGMKLLYAARTAGVTVDLAAGTAGEPGESDRIVGTVTAVQTGSGPDTIRLADAKVTVDSGAGSDTVTAGAGGSEVDAGAGDDTLTGGPGGDRLYGGDGDDRIAGGPGDDDLDGGAGDDAIDAGPGIDDIRGGVGRDRIDARDGTRELVDCNWDPYSATVLQGDVAVLDADDTNRLCERAERSGTPRVEPLAITSTRRILLSCPPRARATACSGTVRVAGDRARPFTVRPGRRTHVAVRLRRDRNYYTVTVDPRSGPTRRGPVLSVARP